MKSIKYKNILIVEDSNEWRDALYEHFAPTNKVTAAKNLAEAHAALQEGSFDILLLDLILPDGDGLSLLDTLNDSIPVVIFSDLGSDEHVLQGLESGAADYIVKPTSLQIVEARMALRLLPPKEAVLARRGLTLNVAKRTVDYVGAFLNLTSNEFNILLFLMQNAGTVFSAAEIYEKVWKMPHMNSKTVRIHLHNLRKKMMQISEECGSLIHTEFGKGYAFCGGEQ